MPPRLASGTQRLRAFTLQSRHCAKIHVIGSCPAINRREDGPVVCGPGCKKSEG